MAYPQVKLGGMTTLITLLVLLLATIRVTRLIVTDKLSEPFRQFLVDKLGAGSWITYLFWCAWCSGFWVSLAATGAAWATTSLPAYIALPAWAGVPVVALAASYIVGWVLTREDNE